MSRDTLTEIGAGLFLAAVFAALAYYSVDDAGTNGLQWFTWLAVISFATAVHGTVKLVRESRDRRRRRHDRPDGPT